MNKPILILFAIVIGIAAGLPMEVWADSPLSCDKDAPMSRGASWSPDGTKIIFDSNRDGNQEIYLMDSTGANVERLTRTQVKNYLPSIAADGRKVVFMSYSETEQAIFVMNIDGTDLTRLTDDQSRNGDPAWSPDGRKIVFHSDRDHEKEEIYVMDADGRNVRRLTHNAFTDYVPRWSPDGKKISFNTTRDGNREIYVMTPEGEDQRNVTRDSLSNMVHSWAPDSERIIFYAPSLKSSMLETSQLSKAHKLALVRSTAELYVIDLDGGNRVQLTHNFFWDQGPVFSPDGKRILFESCRSGNRETWVMKADGTGAKRLTFSVSQSE